MSYSATDTECMHVTSREAIGLGVRFRESDLATLAALIGPFGRSAQPAVYDDDLDAWRRPNDPLIGGDMGRRW